MFAPKRNSDNSMSPSIRGEKINAVMQDQCIVDRCEGSTTELSDRCPSELIRLAACEKEQ